MSLQAYNIEVPVYEGSSLHNRQSRPNFFCRLWPTFFFKDIFFYFLLKLVDFLGKFGIFLEKLGIFRKVWEIFGKFAVADLMADFFFWADFGGCVPRMRCTFWGFWPYSAKPPAHF